MFLWRFPIPVLLSEEMAPRRIPRKFVIPPKQQDREVTRELKDHELFLTAFEKPTQIYRYLETRHSESPAFLHRNLSYLMNFRFSRKKNTRRIGLEYIVDKLKDFHSSSTAILNLKFVGFFEENSNVNESPVELNTYLIKKNLDGEEKRVSVGKHKVPINSSGSIIEREKELSIYIDDFKSDDSVHSCGLKFVIQVPSFRTKTRSGRPAKLSKAFTELSSNEIWIWSEKNLLLTDGLYEVSFEGNQNKENQSTSNNCQWQSLNFDEDATFTASLRFNLALTGLTLKRKNTRLREKDNAVLTKPLIFQFLYEGFSQKTDASFTPNCPWCTVNCGSLYALLKHLRLCHERFCFKYTKTAREDKISVVVNQFFDGSNEGNPYEYSYTHSCLVRGPKRKYPCTKILAYRCKVPEPNLSEFSKFAEVEELTVTKGHHRLYYHSVTGIPKYPTELDEDSEEENDPKWLQDSVTNLVDAFRDVNEGEKEIMKMWNLHVLKYGYVGNSQMESACNSFIEVNGDVIITKNLYRNLLVHLSNLVDFEVITPSILFKSIQALQEKMKNFEHVKMLKIFKPTVKCDDENRY